MRTKQIATVIIFLLCLAISLVFWYFFRLYEEEKALREFDLSAGFYFNRLNLITRDNQSNLLRANSDLYTYLNEQEQGLSHVWQQLKADSDLLPGIFVLSLEIKADKSSKPTINGKIVKPPQPNPNKISIRGSQVEYLLGFPADSTGKSDITADLSTLPEAKNLPDFVDTIWGAKGLLVSKRYFNQINSQNEAVIYFVLPLSLTAGFQKNETNRLNLRYFIFSRLSLNSLLKQMKSETGIKDIPVRLNLLDISPQKAAVAYIKGFDSSLKNNPTLFRSQMSVGGRIWQFEMTPQENFFQALSRQDSWLVLGLGIIISLVLAAIIWFYFAGIQLLQITARNKTILSNILQQSILDSKAASNKEDIFRSCLVNICNYTNWSVGHIFVPDDRGEDIIADIWHIKEPDSFSGFKSNYESKNFMSAESLIDRVLANERYVVINDITNDFSFSKSKINKDLGIRSAFGFPVIVDKDVFAVLEFFSDDIFEDNPFLLKVVDTIVGLFSLNLERFRFKTLIHEFEGIINESMNKTSSAVLVYDEKGKILRVSKKALSLFGYYERDLVGKDLQLLDSFQAENSSKKPLRYYCVSHRVKTKISVESMTKNQVLLNLTLEIKKIKGLNNSVYMAYFNEQKEII